jgi:hypothetical protein
VESTFTKWTESLGRSGVECTLRLRVPIEGIGEQGRVGVEWNRKANESGKGHRKRGRRKRNGEWGSGRVKGEGGKEKEVE